MNVLQQHCSYSSGYAGTQRKNEFGKISVKRRRNRGYCVSNGKEKVLINSNKTPVLIESEVKGLSLDLYKYLLDHTREPEILARARLETPQQFGAGASAMQVTPEQGQFLAMLVKISGAKKILELGVFTGYSSISMALALPHDGMLVAIDRDPKTMAYAENLWKQAGLDSKIRKELGKAKEVLDRILQEEGEGSYDFAFLDADKRPQEAYFEQLMKIIKPGGLILVDNTLWQGRLVDPNATDKNTNAIRDFNAKLFLDKRIDLSIVTVGDGIAICRKL